MNACRAGACRSDGFNIVTTEFERIISCYINAPATEMLTVLKKSMLIRYHATFCGFREGVIVSDDTDVFLLLIFFQKNMTSSLFWKSGT